jgi:hypothetical protein
MEEYFESVHPWVFHFSVASGQSLVILVNLAFLFFPVCFYVAFRTPNPDEETLNDVKRHLKENELDFNQLVKFDTNHC